MEEARLSIPYSQRKYLGRIWHTAASQKSCSPFRPYFLGKPTPELLSEISKVLGRQVKAKYQVIDLGHVRHIKKRHGVGGTAVQGQAPITEALFSLIPDILANFDSVEKGHKTSGDDGVLIKKEYSDGKAVIVNAVPIKGNLKIKSFRVDEIK